MPRVQCEEESTQNISTHESKLPGGRVTSRSAIILQQHLVSPHGAFAWHNSAWYHAPGLTHNEAGDGFQSQRTWMWMVNRWVWLGEAWFASVTSKGIVLSEGGHHRQSSPGDFVSHRTNTHKSIHVGWHSTCAFSLMVRF